MQYLLDTHIVLWWLTNPDKLSVKAQDIIADKNNQVFVSSVSMWEMAIKNELGKLSIPQNILSVLRSENIEVLPLTAAEGLGVADLPKLHTDPFDRILIVQAKLNDMVFISKDPQVLQYPIISVKA